MMQLCHLLVYILAIIIVIYAILEIHYFLRMCLCVVLARLVKPRSNILDTTKVSGICLSTDIDTLLFHMNNARYLREVDFARVDFYERTHLYRTIRQKGGSVFQGAATVRYRRFIRPFRCFQIFSRIIYWDDQSIYMEHRFINPSDKFIHCIVICRQRVLDCSVFEIMSELLASAIETTTTASSTTCLESGHLPQVEVKLEMPSYLQKWIEYNDLSSKCLRGG